MKFRTSSPLATILLSTTIVYAQSPTPGTGAVIIPKSNVVLDSTKAPLMHTNVRFMALPPAVTPTVAQPPGSPPFPGYLFETPASIGCLYRLVAHSKPGCNPNVVTENPSGGVGAIAVVDAYDDPTAAADLAVFSNQFGLPAANFQVVAASGTTPPQDPTGGWETEASIDIEWAHAMAPQAQIILVEADSNQPADLLSAILVASALVSAAGGGEVSMSWSSNGEFSQETDLDAIFTVTPGVVYFAATGDAPGPQWPAVSPYVVAAGGTSISRDPASGNAFLESAWQEAGSGLSIYESRPSFQDSIRYVVGKQRGVPDLSFDANPSTGVWIYSTSGVTKGWQVVGGTSVAAPSLAGIANAAGALRASSASENAYYYKNSRRFRDITYGNCGLYLANFAGFGWDLCTGLGSPLDVH